MGNSYLDCFEEWDGGISHIARGIGGGVQCLSTLFAGCWL